MLPLHMRRQEFDPDPELAAVREQPGLRRVPTPYGREAWLVTRYDDVRHVLRNAELFSYGSGISLPPMSEEQSRRLRAGSLLLMDPPDHTRLRRMLTPSSRCAASAAWSRASTRSSPTTWTRWNAPAPRPT